MDEFCPFSRSEAKREGELDRWEKSHWANIECARDIRDLIASHAKDGQLEADCARAVLDRWGFLRVQFVLANTLTGTGGLGFEPDSLRWARSVFVPPDASSQASYPSLPAAAESLLISLRLLSPQSLKGGFAGAPARAQRSGSRGERRSKGANAVFAIGGNGVERTLRRRRRAVFATCLGDGEKARWNRADFAGVLDEQYLPDWAMEKLAELRPPEQEQADGPAQGGMEMG